MKAKKPTAGERCYGCGKPMKHTSGNRCRGCNQHVCQWCATKLNHFGPINEGSHNTIAAKIRRAVREAWKARGEYDNAIASDTHGMDNIWAIPERMAYDVAYVHLRGIVCDLRAQLAAVTKERDEAMQGFNRAVHRATVCGAERDSAIADADLLGELVSATEALKLYPKSASSQPLPSRPCTTAPPQRPA